MGEDTVDLYGVNMPFITNSSEARSVYDEAPETLSSNDITLYMPLFVGMYHNLRRLGAVFAKKGRGMSLDCYRVQGLW